MTPEEHNKRLGILHLAYGGLNALLLAVAAFVALPVFYVFWNEPGRNAPPSAFIFMVIAVAALAPLLFVTPALVAGGALLKRKSWGRTAGIVAAILMALNFPFGTALAVYTLWFLLGRGVGLYEDESVRFARYALGDAPPPPVSDWVETDRRREPERAYVPPTQPPDWR
jgi:hypothetical protein